MDISSFLDFLYPKFCLSCGKEKTYLCPDCFSKIETFKSPVCPYCKSRSFDGSICKKHQKLPQEFGGQKNYLAGFATATSYKNENIKKIIEALKYQFVKELSKPLAFLVLKFLKKNPEIEFFKNPTDFIIVPIPLHPRRIRWRGFNQSEEIAKELSPLVKIPVKNNILFKKKHKKPQATLKRKERIENIKGAFGVGEKSLKEIQNKKIILLDDVTTTLSTLQEAAKVLKESGAKKTWAITVTKG